MMDKTIIKPFNEVEFRIYGYTLPEVPNHDGYVKVGDTTRNVEKRIFEQVGTAGLNPRILFEKKARKSDGSWFRDKDLHKYFLLNGIQKKDFNGRADEWFYFNENIDKAEELTDKFISQDYDEVQIDEIKSNYYLRSEQHLAVKMTHEYLKGNNEPKEFLWNAKPRFGKTLTTFDFIRSIKAQNILIVTNRPAIANSWFDDFNRFIAWQEPQLKFISETESLREKAMTREQYLEYLNTTFHSDPSQITFISLQDLKGAKFAGGPYNKLEWISGLDWDLLVVDEAHEGIDTRKTDIAFSQIKRKFTLHLSGTPFKALANNKFTEKQIFNWSYIDEQQAKQSWDVTIGSNPYENLPTLNLFTYQMSKMIEKKVLEGINLEEEKNVDYAFDLNEFFKVKENGKFEYEESVIRFVDNLTRGKFPFSNNQYREELNHTFWLLPRVNAVKALEKLLNIHPIFKNYRIILAAGDGVSLHSSMEYEAIDFKENTKSFDKVKKAIKEFDRTITLSVGQLTTGVTIPEWTGVLMLNNIKSPSLYFQAAFRAQNPYEFEKNGIIYRKENAYIFDFSPDRTLLLYDEFANNLSGSSIKTVEERKRKIKKILNFFPVIAEDENGNMHEVSATEVLTIPNRITSKEVVKRGFMSNLLFANISGIFSSYAPFKEILDKISPEKNKRFEKPREINMAELNLNDIGEIEVPKEVVIGKSKDLFGEKIYVTIDHVNNIISSLESTEEIRKQAIGELTNEVNSSIYDGIKKLKDTFNLNIGQTEILKKKVDYTLEYLIEEQSLTLRNQIYELNTEFEDRKNEAREIKNEDKIKEITNEFEIKKNHIEKTFTEKLNKNFEKTVNEVVEEQIEKMEEKKKKSTEDDVRDHLRGFARTIPSFLMAYGDSNTNLKNFEENINKNMFKELTSITVEEFKQLREGFEYLDENGETKIIPGLFNEVVFNASIKEFLDTKNRLADYFDDSLQEDIFDYIPSQKTNQIFTPKRVVKAMIDTIEKENPGIFLNKTIKFIDLYVKSGLYITEIVKRLNKGLKNEFPEQKERIKWILENQVYACAPSDIIYNIVKNFIFSNLNDLSTNNLKLIDTIPLVSEQKLNKNIKSIYGDDNLKFDIVIGNPPYQNEGIGEVARDEPIYHKFMEESYKIADIVCFVTPARFLFNAGQTPKKWNEKMLSDEHLKVIYYEQNSAKVFPNTDIKGGIAITYRDANKNFGSIGTFTHLEEINSILLKILNEEFDSFNCLLYGKSSYKFTTKIYEENPILLGRVSISEAKSIGSNVFNKLPEIFFDEKQNVNQIRILGRENNSRVFKWINSRYVEGHPNFEKFKVILPATNGTGVFGEALSTPIIGEPSVGYTQTFISFGAFEKKIEAENVLKYLKTKFVRALLGTMKITQHNQTKEVWKNIPLQDYTSNSDLDWSKSIDEIDRQLYKKYNFNQQEIKFIEENVRLMS